MNIKSVRIVDGKLLLMGDDREFYLMDGVYRRENGETITVSDHQIVNVLAIPDFSNATKEQLENYVADLGEQSLKVIEDTQLLQFDFQIKMQQINQAITMMSNILKQFHDTSNAIIRNIR